MDSQRHSAWHVAVGRPSLSIGIMLIYEGTTLVGKVRYLGQKVELRLDGATYWLKDMHAVVSWLEITLRHVRIG